MAEAMRKKKCEEDEAASRQQLLRVASFGAANGWSVRKLEGFGI